MAETANAGVQMAKRRPQTAIAGARPTLFPANREGRRSANNSDRDAPKADGDRYAELEQHQTGLCRVYFAARFPAVLENSLRLADFGRILLSSGQLMSDLRVRAG